MITLPLTGAVIAESTDEPLNNLLARPFAPFGPLTLGDYCAEVHERKNLRGVDVAFMLARGEDDAARAGARATVALNHESAVAHELLRATP